MALLEFHGKPSDRELRWFSLVMLAFAGMVGGLVLWRTGSTTAATAIWAIGAALVVLYVAIQPLRLPIYLAWMFAVYPIGWLLSHLLMGVIYFLLVTPTALVMRLLRADPLARRLDRNADTYWVELPRSPERSRYFRQF